MIRTIFIQLLLCVSLVLTAQTNADQEGNNYLIPVDKEQERKMTQGDSSLFLYARETTRLLTEEFESLK